VRSDCYKTVIPTDPLDGAFDSDVVSHRRLLLEVALDIEPELLQIAPKALPMLGQFRGLGNSGVGGVGRHVQGSRRLTLAMRSIERSK
jgi:hypothetical protein